MKFFKLNTLSVLLMLLMLVLSAAMLKPRRSGSPPGYTNAPGESNCTSCHSGSLITSGSQFNNLKITTNMSTGGYLPDSTYNITVSYSETGVTRFGFQATILRALNNRSAGTLASPSSQTQRQTTMVNGQQRQYIDHGSIASASSGNGSKSWTFEWTAPSTNQGDVRLYISLNAANNNGGSSGDDIIAKSFTFSPSSRIPSGTITASKTSVCVGDTIEFTASGTQNTNGYNWTFPSGSVRSSTQQKIKVAFTSPGTKQVRLVVSNAFANSSAVTRNITVNAAPEAEISTQGSLEICAGDSVVLDGKTANGQSYLWSTGENTSSIVVKKGGRYAYEVTNASGCQSTSDSVTVVVRPTLPMSISLSPETDSLCSLDSVLLSAQSNEHQEYSWFVNGQPWRTSADSSIYFKDMPGKYELSVQALDQNGCSTAVAAPKTVTIIEQAPAPQITCDSAAADYLIIGWNDDPALDGVEISADSGKTWQAPNFNNDQFRLDGLSFSTFAEFRIRGFQKDNPCFYTAEGSEVCKTKACFALTYDLKRDDEICLGEQATIEFSNINLSRYALRPLGGVYSKQLKYRFSPTLDSSFRFEVVDSNQLSCPADVILVDVKVNQPPNATLRTVANESDFCLGEDITFVVNQQEGATYSFSLNGNVVQSGSNNRFNTVAASSDDVYAVEVVSDKGCSVQGENLKVTVNPLPVPGPSASIDDLSVQFNDETADINSWSWDFGDGNSAMQQNPLHSYASYGDYTVSMSVIDQNGCRGDSAFDISLVNTSSISESPYGWELKAYPNPSTGILNLELSLPDREESLIQVLDGQGKPYFEGRYNQRYIQEQLDLGGLPSGIYFLRIAQGDASLSRVLMRR